MTDQPSDKISLLRKPANEWRSQMASFQPGFVWLAGAGPGHVRHLTLEVFQALQEADVIFYDALVSQEVLNLASSSAKLEFVGKRAGKPSLSQSDITRRLITAARANQRVLRLKGGDPFIFGRGAEEALNLQKEGIGFRILPGITAGIGGLGQANIPLSHRDFNQSITFITAHDANGSLSQGVDWQALGDGAQLLVVYMGLRLLDEIKTQLALGGMALATPVALISNASLENEHIVFTSLGEMASDAKTHGLKAPVVTLIGETVLIAKTLRDANGADSGFDHLPLLSQNVQQN